MSVYLIDYENVHAAGLAGVENCTMEDEIILLYGNNTSSIPMELHIQIASSNAKVQYHKIERTGKNYLDFQLSTIAGYLVGTTRQSEFVIVSKDSGFDAVLDFWNFQKMADRQLHFVRRESICQTEEKSEKPVKKRRPGRPKNNRKPLTTVGEETVKISDVNEQTEKELTEEKEPQEKRDPQERLQTTEAAAPVVLTEAMKKKIRAAVKELELKPTDYTKIYKVCKKSADKQELHQNLVHALKQEKGAQIYKAIVGIIF